MRQPSARRERHRCRAAIQQRGLGSVTPAATSIPYRCTLMEKKKKKKKQYLGSGYDWLSTWMLSSILSLRSAITWQTKKAAGTEEAAARWGGQGCGLRVHYSKGGRGRRRGRGAPLMCRKELCMLLITAAPHPVAVKDENDREPTQS